MEISESLKKVTLEAAVIIGRTPITIGDAERLDKGSLVILNTSPQDPVDLVVNGKVVARGEVIVDDNRLGLRITELLTA